MTKAEELIRLVETGQPIQHNSVAALVNSLGGDYTRIAGRSQLIHLIYIAALLARKLEGNNHV